MDTLNVMKDFKSFASACGREFDAQSEDVVFLSLEVSRYSNSSKTRILKRRLVLTSRAIYLFALSSSSKWKGPPKRRLPLENIEAAVMSLEDAKKVILIVTKDDKDGRDMILSTKERETLVEAVGIAKDGVNGAEPLAILELEERHIERMLANTGKKTMGKSRVVTNLRDISRTSDLGGSFRFSMDVSARTDTTRKQKKFDELGSMRHLVLHEDDDGPENDSKDMFFSKVGNGGTIQTIGNFDMSGWDGKDYDFGMARCPRANGDLGPVASLWKRVFRTLSVLSIPSLSTPKLREIALKLSDIAGYRGPTNAEMAIKALAAVLMDQDMCRALIKEMNNTAPAFLETLEALTGYSDPKIRRWAVLGFYNALQEVALQSQLPDSPYWTFMLNYNIMDGSYVDPTSTTGRDYIPDNHPNIVLSELFRDSVWNAELLESVTAKNNPNNPDHRRTTIAQNDKISLLGAPSTTNSISSSTAISNRRQSTLGEIASDVVTKLTLGRIASSRVNARLRNQEHVRALSKDSTRSNGSAGDKFLDSEDITIININNDGDIENGGVVSRIASSEDGISSEKSGSFRSMTEFKVGGLTSDSESLPDQSSSSSVPPLPKSKPRSSIFGFATGMLSTPSKPSNLGDETTDNPASQKTKKPQKIIYSQGRIKSAFARMWLGRLVDLETSTGEFAGIKESDITTIFQILLDQVPDYDYLFMDDEQAAALAESANQASNAAAAAAAAAANGNGYNRAASSNGHVDEIPFEPFGAMVCVPELFLTLFGAFTATVDDSLRRDGLKNLALLLLRNPRAQISILSIPSWQGSLFPIFTRVPFDPSTRTEEQKKTFQLARHIFASLLSQPFLEPECPVSLENVINGTCFEIANYAGWNPESVSFLRDILQGLLNIIAASSEDFSSTWKYEPGSYQWDSLLRLTSIAQTFFFYRPCEPKLFLSMQRDPSKEISTSSDSQASDADKPNRTASNNERLKKSCPEWLLNSNFRSLLLPQPTAAQFASRSGAIFSYMQLPALSAKYKGKQIGIHLDLETGRCEDSNLLSSLMTLWRVCGIYGSKEVDTIKIKESSQKKSERAKMQYASSLVSDLVATQKIFQEISDNFSMLGIVGSVTMVQRFMDRPNNQTLPTTSGGISFLNRAQLGRTVSSRLNIGTLPPPNAPTADASSNSMPVVDVKVSAIPTAQKQQIQSSASLPTSFAASSREITSSVLHLNPHGQKETANEIETEGVPVPQKAQKTVMDEARLEGDTTIPENQAVGSGKHLGGYGQTETSGSTRNNLVKEATSKRHIMGLQQQQSQLMSTRDIFGVESVTGSTIDALRSSLAAKDRNSAASRASNTSRLSVAGGRTSSVSHHSRASKASGYQGTGSSGHSGSRHGKLDLLNQPSKSPKVGVDKSPKIKNSPGKFSPSRRYRNVGPDGQNISVVKDKSGTPKKNQSPARRPKQGSSLGGSFDLNDGHDDQGAPGPTPKNIVQEQMSRLESEFQKASVQAKREAFKNSKGVASSAKGSNKGFRRPSDLAPSNEIEQAKTAAELAIENALKRQSEGFRRSSQFDLDTKTNVMASAIRAASRGIAANISRQKVGFRRPSGFEGANGAPQPEFLGGSTRNIAVQQAKEIAILKQTAQEVSDELPEDDVVRLTKVSKCVRCNKACISSVLTISRFGEQWHDQCFTCSNCGVHIVEKSLLETARYFEDVGLLVCSQPCKNAIVRISNEPGMPPRCTSCLGLFALDEVAFEACGGHWHAEHFSCVSCGELFKDDSAEYYEKDGMPWCPSCFKAEFEEAHSCMNCGIFVTDLAHFPGRIELFGRVWCSQKHFVCTACGNPFRNGKYFVGGSDDSSKLPYCEKHYFERFVPPCKRCGIYLTAQAALTAVTVDENIVYHSDCLSCSVCNKQLTSQTASVHQASKRVFCRNCSPDSLAVTIKCDGCGETIEGSYVTAIDNEGLIDHAVMFHTACFVCSEDSCKTMLIDVEYYWKKDRKTQKVRPYCGNHI